MSSNTRTATQIDPQMRRNATDFILTLRDPQSGGFAFARGNQPTLMGTAYAIHALEFTGELHRLSAAHRDAAVHFLMRCCRPDGTFCDPLFDTSQIATTQHDASYFIHEATCFAQNALDALGAPAPRQRAFPPALLTPDGLKKEFDGYDWSDPHLNSNRVMFWMSQLAHEVDRHGRSDLLPLMDAGLDWMDAHQSPETGLWSGPVPVGLSAAMAATFHFTFFYAFRRRPLLHLERIIDSCLELQKPDGLFSRNDGVGQTCLDYDALDLVAKATLVTDYRRGDVQSAFHAAHRTLLGLLNADGGFANVKEQRKANQCLPTPGLYHTGLKICSCDNRESNVFSTWFRLLALALCDQFRWVDSDNNTFCFRRLPWLGYHDVGAIRRSYTKEQPISTSRDVRAAQPDDPFHLKQQQTIPGKPEMISTELNMSLKGVSVIVMSADHSAERLDQFLASFFVVNTHTPVEVIIPIEAGDAGNRREVVLKYAARAFIRPVVCTGNKPVSEIANLCASKARYPFLFFIEDQIKYTLDFLGNGFLIHDGLDVEAIGLSFDKNTNPIKCLNDGGLQDFNIEYFGDKNNRTDKIIQIPKHQFKKYISKINDSLFLICKKDTFESLNGFSEIDCTIKTTGIASNGNKYPKISVVMASYNREKYIKFAVDSILNQTFTDFEFIIIDDDSKDSTPDILKSYADSDQRIKLVRNKVNQGLTKNLIAGVNMAKGKYIARMDDDDISELSRFEKQYEFMENNPDIAVVGSFINIIGNTNAKSWVCETDPDILEFLMAFLNPLCHPTVMIRRSFFVDKGINYDTNSYCAQEYKLWHDIINAGGKIANIPNILLNYRVHPVKLTNTHEMKKLQAEVAIKIKYDLLSKLSIPKPQYEQVIDTVRKFCRCVGSASEVIELLETIKPSFKERTDFGYAGFNKFLNKLLCEPEYRISLETKGKLSYKKIHNDNSTVLHEASKQCKIQNLYTPYDKIDGSNSELCIAFAFDENYAIPALVTIYSLLSSAKKETIYNVYILIDESVTQKSLLYFVDLFSRYKRHTLFAIDVGKIFDGFYEVRHITKATYYRLILHNILKKTHFILYIDVDVVILKDLSELSMLAQTHPNYYLMAVRSPSISDILATHFKSDPHNYFNAGILVMNLRAIRENHLGPVFLKEALKGYKVVDQDVLNIICKNKIMYLHPRYNCHTWIQKNKMNGYYDESEVIDALSDPAIFHWNGKKPWNDYINTDCSHLWWRKYKEVSKIINIKNVDLKGIQKPSYGQIVNIKRLTPKFENYFFGYFDIASTDRKNNHLALQVSFLHRLPTEKDTANICIIDSDCKIEHIDKTSSWNFQQGSLLQFRPHHENEIIYNIYDSNEKKYKSVVLDIKSKHKKILPLPIANVSPKGDKALSINFSRLFDYRPGYGYCNIPDPFFGEIHPKHDGVFLMDLDSGDYKMILSYDHLWELYAKGTKNENDKVLINHINFNTDGTRFLMLFRFFSDRRPWPTYTLTSDIDGKNIHKIFAFGSHYHWKDSKQLAITGANVYEKSDAKYQTLYELEDISGNSQELDKEFFNGDGHCSYSHDRRYMLYDSYSTPQFPYRKLQVYDLLKKQGKTLAYLYSDPALYNNISDCRCDLHPRWSHDGDFITFDSIHEGYRAIYQISVHEIKNLFLNDVCDVTLEDAKKLFHEDNKESNKKSKLVSNNDSLPEQFNPDPLPLIQKYLKSCKVHANKNSLFSHLPKATVVAEVNVHFGQITKMIFDIINPKKHYAIDLFNTHEYKHIWDKNVPEIFKDKTDYEFYSHKFNKELEAGKLNILQGAVYNMLENLPDSGIDIFVINADSTYDILKPEVELAIKKVKPDGHLVFLKYIYFNHRTRQYPGVVQVVNELCVKGGFQLVHFVINHYGFCDVVINYKNNTSNN